MESKTGRFVIVFNGEIYNHKILKEELISSYNYKSFKGSSDTEILLEYLDNKGIEGIRDCDGRFSLALYDKYENWLYLIRDRMGEKPLYYGFCEGHFIFSSTLRAIQATDFFSNDLNYKCLEMYFRWGYIPQPYSVYKDIYKLPAGSYLKINVNNQEYDITKFWDVSNIARTNLNSFEGTYEEAVIQFEDILTKNIKIKS